MPLEGTKHERNGQAELREEASVSNDFYATLAQCTVTLNCFTYMEISLKNELMKVVHYKRVISSISVVLKVCGCCSSIRITWWENPKPLSDL